MIDRSTNRIYLSPPDLTGNEEKLIHEILKSNWVAPVGPQLHEFEKLIAKATGYKYAVALNSGTSAVHLALRCNGVGSNDEVVCSTMTFCGSVNPVLYLGAHPVLMDSRNEDWNIDPSLLDEYLNKSDKLPAAIVVTHLYGMPAAIKEIEAIAGKFSVPVIHDLAEAIGARLNDQLPGAISDMAILSFNGNKLITSGGGGALVTNNSDHYKKALHLATQAKMSKIHYEFGELGYNYRLSNVLAGIGIAQISALSHKVSQKRRIYENYRSELESDQIQFQTEPEGHYSDRWLTCIQIDQTSKNTVRITDIIQALENKNIESRPAWKPMHMQPLYKDAKTVVTGISENLFRNGLCLPSGTSLEEKDQEKIISVIKKLVR